MILTSQKRYFDTHQNQVYQDDQKNDMKFCHRAIFKIKTEEHFDTIPIFLEDIENISIAAPRCECPV